MDASKGQFILFHDIPNNGSIHLSVFVKLEYCWMIHAIIPSDLTHSNRFGKSGEFR